MRVYSLSYSSGSFVEIDGEGCHLSILMQPGESIEDTLKRESIEAKEKAEKLLHYSRRLERALASQLPLIPV